MLGDLQLTIISPATKDEEIFRWIPCKPGEIREENSEIVDIISWITSDVKELSENPLLIEMLKQTDRSSFTDVSNLCGVYNKAITDVWHMWTEGGVVPDFYNRKASRDHIQFILLQCYNRAVSDPEKLNQYPPFSPQVYGETSFELISQMIDAISVASDDIFIDLGSGVGQVVLQVSASTDAKFCYGIEKAEYPAYCASRLDSAFRHWMGFYGKSYRPYKLERGDFLSSEYQEQITNASVLFANNFAFGPEVDHQLKQRFANLKEGARIISSKAFCPLNFRITDRNLGDIGSIMRVSCLNPIQDAVSWTDKPFSYYVHTIDRSLLEQYFARLKNPKSKDENNIVRRDRKGRIISEIVSRESSNSSTTNNQNNSNSNTNHKSKRPTALTKHHSNSFRSLPKRSASLPDVTKSKTNIITNNVGRRKSSLQNCLSTKETNGHRIVNGSIVMHRMRSRSRRRRNSQRWQSELKRSFANSEDNKISCGDNILSTNNGSNTVLVESCVDEQLASLSIKGSGICGDDEAEKQFPTAVRNLLNSSPCGNDLLSKTDVIKQSVHRRGKTITNTKLDFNYPVIDDCLSVNSSSSHDLRDSRNSSSSPYVSSLSSANRSPNSQMDEIPPALNSTTNHSESTLRSVQSHNLSMVSEDELNKNKSDQPPHIRIKFRISNSTGNQDHPLNVEIKSSPPDDKRNTSQSHSPKNTNDNDKLDNIDKDHSTSVANRRIMRKCRQLLSHDLSHVTNSKSSNNRTIVLRKRIQKCLLNSNNTGSTDKSTSPQSNSPSSCKLNRHNNNRSNKLKHAHVHSRSDLRNNLDILHNHTVTNVHSKPTPTKYGMNDKRFSAYAFHYQPVDVYTEGDKNYLKDSSVSDIHIGYNKAPVPLALTQYLELTKQAFMDHFAMLQSPAYASTIKSELERERNRQTELLKHTKALEQSIAKLHADGTELLNRFTKRLGILITTPAAFFAQARRLIKHHHALEEKISEFRKQISHLSAANQELVKRHQIEAARLLAAATMNKSDNASQHHQHQQYSSNQSAYVSDVKTTQARRNGFCHDPTNIPPSTVTRSGLVNGLNSTLLSSALMIPPPPSLTKVSNNTADSSNYHYPPIVPSDRLVFSHETPQHSLGSLPSSNLKYTTSVASPIFLHNNSSSNTAPILLKTLNTTSPSTTANVTFHVADCDSRNINISSNNNNHRTIQQGNIPPPPPLLPMHIHSDSPYTTSTTTTTTTSAVWSSSPSYHNRHYFMDNNDISNDIPSLLPEINRSFITSRTDYEASNSQASRHHHYNKSMHASVQDLILDEFSRQTPAISINNSVSTINANNKSICSNSSDSVCDYLQEQRYPDSPIQRHRHHHHNHDRHSNNHHHHKGVQPNSIDYSHQFNLPPRKRHWDSHNSIVTTSINNVNFDENCISSKLPRNHSFISSSSSSSSTTTQHHNKNTSWSQNLSPPTLSPVSLDDVPSTTDFSLQFDQHDINSSFPPCHNSNNFNVTATSTGELNKN